MSSFEWKHWQSGTLPELEAHSRAKLSVLGSYVTDYICILCADSFGRESFKITLIDGFAGGGVYRGGELGSPFTILDAVAAAETKINAGRRKPLLIDCHCYFVDSDPDALACLRVELENSPYKSRLSHTVFLMQGTFRDRAAEIVARTKDRFTRGGARAIFFLDQCGYTDVHPLLLRQIATQLNNKAEFILNFAVGWFIDFAGDTPEFRQMLSNLGIDAHVSAKQLAQAKEKYGTDWRYVIEAMIGPALRNAAGAPFFSPFYIVPIGNHRGYWLLHLAPHIRARSAMLDVYWRNANGHRHYGHLGLNMLSYKPTADPEGYLNGFAFDDLARKSAQSQLKLDFARVIRDSHQDGVRFRDFAEHYCNQTIANEALIASTLEELHRDGEILIRGPKGSAKRAGAVGPNDIILPCNQLLFGPLSA
jgi:three-Cys-motif partner protein